MVKTQKKNTSATNGKYYYDEAAAQRVVDFFANHLVHTKGKWQGQKFKLLPWQEKQVIRPLFGWKRADGTRKYRAAYIEIPKKNGKSELGAGIALYLLFADSEPGAEVYSAANDILQARIVFDVAKYMVQNDSALRTRGKPFKYTITVEQTNSFYRVLSAIVKSKHGFNIHGAIFDELHAQKDRELWDVLTAGSGAARRQPLIVALTTAGVDRNSICWEIHDYAGKVRDGVIEDDAFLPVIYAADENVDWTDPKEWAKVNPSLGITITEEYLQDELKFAKESLSRQAVFRQFHLNHWLQHASKWIDLDVWNENGKEEINEGELIGRGCYAGLDLSSNTDITALILIFPPEDKDEDPFVLLPYFWIPEDNIYKRVHRDRVPYDMWIEKGFIKATPGNVVDLRYIRETIKELGELYKIKEIAYDRWRATQLIEELGETGFTMVPFGQGYFSMAPACETFERILLGRQVAHGNNPVLKWMASNVVVLKDPAGNIKPNKGKSTDRIDGIVATVMALDRAVRHQHEAESVYDERGLLFV